MSTTFLPSYSVGPDAYEEIGFVTKFYGKTVAVVGGETALKKASPRLLPALEKAGLAVSCVEVYGKDATRANVEKIRTNPAVAQADMIFGVGGGRAVDTVKTAADLMDKPFFTCPTLASNCAPVSAIAVLYKEDGSLDGYHFTKRCPNHGFIDTTVVLDSPEELFWAGIGDALSKGCESAFSSRGKALAHTPMLGVQVAAICEGPLLRYGKAALDDFRAGRVTEAFSETVLDIIISTGIASNLLTTEHAHYFNSSLAHCFYNSTMVLPAGHRHLHGETVSFGCLVLMAFDGNDEGLERLARFNKSLGLPVKPADLAMTPDDLDPVIERAQMLREWTCVPEGVTVTPESFRAAILKADAFGRTLEWPLSENGPFYNAPQIAAAGCFFIPVRERFLRRPFLRLRLFLVRRVRAGRRGIVRQWASPMRSCAKSDKSAR